MASQTSRLQASRWSSRHRRGADLKARPPSAISVLIAESDTALAELYSQALDGKGWTVETLSDAAAVLARVQEHPPTVLLLNTLRDADPVTMVEDVRSLPGTQKLIIAVLLESLDRISVERMRGLDVQAWLSKTRMTREQLAETILGLVAGARIP